MARRKKTKKSRSRRRRMGAIGGGSMAQVLGIVAGAVAGRMVANKLLPNVDSKIKNAAVIAVGAFVLPKFLKGDMGKALGNGMIAAGGAGLVGELVPGIGAVEDTIDFPVQVGEVADTLSVVAGDEVMAGDDLTVMAGIEEEEDY